MSPDPGPASLWFPRREASSSRRVRLLCLPFAGGTASAFRHWQAALPEVEVCAAELPGRARRLGEAPLRSIPAMVAGLQEALAGLEPRPMVFFGHSMGARLAHRLAHAIEQAGGAGPSWVIVSASRPPRPPPPRSQWRSQLPDEAFLAFLRGMGGIPEALLAEPAIIGLLMPAIRADFEAAESLDTPRPLRIAAGLAAFGGDADHVAPADQLKEWSLQTSGRFLTRVFEGGHFYLDTARDELLCAVRSIAAEVQAAANVQVRGIAGR